VLLNARQPPYHHICVIFMWPLSINKQNELLFMFYVVVLSADCFCLALFSVTCPMHATVCIVIWSRLAVAFALHAAYSACWCTFHTHTPLHRALMSIQIKYSSQCLCLNLWWISSLFTAGKTPLLRFFLACQPILLCSDISYDSCCVHLIMFHCHLLGFFL